MSYKLGDRSIKNLEGVDTRMCDIVKLAITITKQDFTVTEGLRTLARQKQLVKEGYSKTLNSKHLTGLAVDMYPYYDGSVHVNAPHEKFLAISQAMKEAAEQLGYNITWGGDWKSFVDKPHYQLEV